MINYILKFFLIIHFNILFYYVRMCLKVGGLTMKRNNFDPFMINNFSNLSKQSKFSSLPTNEIQSDELMSMTFMEKRTNMSIPKVRTGLVLFVTSNSLGENNELGISLIKNLCNSVSTGLDLPEYIFLINTGVRLIEDKDIMDTFKRMKKYGTNIVLSFESLKYFEIEECSKSFAKWSIGDITTVLVNSKNVIKI